MKITAKIIGICSAAVLIDSGNGILVVETVSAVLIDSGNGILVV